jgi:hypothetical protein
VRQLRSRQRARPHAVLELRGEHLMAAKTALPQALATEREVAAYLRKSPGTLRNWRSEGVGPPSIRVGHATRYRWPDVEAWIAAQNP